jgi:hypothetical protein
VVHEALHQPNHLPMEAALGRLGGGFRGGGGGLENSVPH